LARERSEHRFSVHCRQLVRPQVGGERYLRTTRAQWAWIGDWRVDYAVCGSLPSHASRRAGEVCHCEWRCKMHAVNHLDLRTIDEKVPRAASVEKRVRKRSISRRRPLSSLLLSLPTLLFLELASPGCPRVPGVQIPVFMSSHP